ncbi:LacI family transcriptional regulator [Corynebacterium yudongzhengii]|uniref:LacI family DNA-binding transcriptional regulator n=1 Tax=Corynebacterium yudongzhengii TaxID=2080740 RepID=A0A2U1T6U6_9CORY|nr:LacI family DNA-binding transcriptional regulator [Corynebacterium yudongzhengii]AWB82267.1 LacI family transcriptional regulator [Corynebacterium yudongzhengii]PWC01716.1 LacI family DNA-binding transcriptional regulator [Corynebacterium yudongzhengii]
MDRDAQRATLKDVAEAAGTSISTASRALSGNPAVAPATRARIQRIATEMGYRPNAQAQALRRSFTNTIGVVVPSLINYYFASMVTAIQREASAAGLSTIIANSQERSDTLADALQVFADQRVDGIICVPHEGCSRRLLGMYRSGMPIVLIDRELEGSTIPTITSDAAASIAEAVGIFSDAGAQPIGYLSGPMETSTGRSRLEAFRRACAELGIGEQRVFLGGYTQERGRCGASELIDAGCRALLAGDSMMTIGVIEECHRRGLVIGHDLEVIGFDTQPLFQLQPRPIMVIDQHVDEMATRAFHALDGMIHGKTPKPLRGFSATTLFTPAAHNPTHPGGEP